MGQHGKDDPDEFMRCRKDSLLIGLSGSPFLLVVLPEHLVVLYDTNGHQPDDSP